MCKAVTLPCQMGLCSDDAVRMRPLESHGVVTAILSAKRRAVVAINRGLMRALQRFIYPVVEGCRMRIAVSHGAPKIAGCAGPAGQLHAGPVKAMAGCGEGDPSNGIGIGAKPYSGAEG